MIKGLVCVQFVIAIAMVICTSVVFKQLHYLQNADLGLDKEDMVVADCGLFDFMSYMGGYGIDDYKQEVLKNPNVRSVTGGVELSDYLQGICLFISLFFRNVQRLAQFIRIFGYLLYCFS